MKKTVALRVSVPAGRWFYPHFFQIEKLNGCRALIMNRVQIAKIVLLRTHYFDTFVYFRAYDIGFNFGLEKRIKEPIF